MPPLDQNEPFGLSQAPSQLAFVSRFPGCKWFFFFFLWVCLLVPSRGFNNCFKVGGVRSEVVGEEEKNDWDFVVGKIWLRVSPITETERTMLNEP